MYTRVREDLLTGRADDLSKLASGLGVEARPCRSRQHSVYAHLSAWVRYEHDGAGEPSDTVADV